MNKNAKNMGGWVQVLLPSEKQWDDKIFSQNILPLADQQVIGFISQLSQTILKNPEFRVHPELMAMGFWMRKAHVLKIIKENISEPLQGVRLARGVVFHIAPSNVDSIFIYSWFLSMLAGNINIIRLSSKSGEQIDLLLKTLNDLFKLPEYSQIASRQMILSYGHDDRVTAYLSAHCDMRVIWGGDNTIQKIRRIELPPTAIELPFTDKFSLSLLDATAFLALDKNNKDKLIHSFINDAYWFGQMACSSPRLIVWKGDKESIENAKTSFWEGIHVYLSPEFAEISAADIVNKLVVSQSMAITADAVLPSTKNNLISRVQLNSLDELQTDLHCGAGLFYEYSINELKELMPLASRKIQTVGCFGVSSEELKNFISEQMPQGFDRFVPIGKALDFSPVWDGYNLLDEFTRTIEIQ